MSETMAETEVKSENTEQPRELVRGVLSPKFTAGPHGLGDPDDKSLRKLEKQVLIPQKIRQKTRTEKCVDEVRAFTECGKEAGLLVWLDCRDANKKLWDCAEKWFYDKDFVAQCTEEYLNERSEYRRTGVGVKYMKRKHSAMF
ncbi:COX assembly mitochondrial protein homolog [Fopius arisanus]|uniref:COX assembly mitochondrial protein n=1 Tax=Fopius arisanus TaxID=64838 RepID=A0A0C9R0Q9_9HYME|nr:PREDICTED: COX assembly mitochondrial protein homolog [Fopius arisanus]